MLGFRERLAIGLGLFVLVIASVGIVTVRRLNGLGRAVDVILEENFRSVLACQDMKEAAERMDSGALFVLVGRQAEGRALIRENLVRFREALSRELGNITIEGEAELARSLEQRIGAYEAGIESLLGPGLGPEQRLRVYDEVLHPEFLEIKAAAQAILDLNQSTMIKANSASRRQARAAIRQTTSLLAVALVLGAAMVWLVGRWVLVPVRLLTESAEEIQHGNLDLVLPEVRRDELGRLSSAFNAMTASLRASRRTDMERLDRIQQVAQKTLDTLPEAVAVLDSVGYVEMSTELARQAFGLKRGAQARTALHPVIRALATEACGELGRRREITLPVFQHFIDGQERFFKPHALPITDWEGNPTGIALLVEDVTALRLGAELSSGVLSTLSHQFNSPLTSVRMALHLLLDRTAGPLTPKQEELAAAAKEDADKLHRIVGELLDMGRLRAGWSPLSPAPLRPDDILSEALEEFRAEARDRGIQLSVEVQPDLPNVSADAQRLSHVFNNLLSNALKHTATGGSVVLSAERAGSEVRFSVRDTGKGIPPEAIPDLFKPFFRVEGRDGEGSGLGLAIVREIVEAHRGRVSVDSSPGAGSTFSLTLPVAGEALP